MYDKQKVMYPLPCGQLLKIRNGVYISMSDVYDWTTRLNAEDQISSLRKWLKGQIYNNDKLERSSDDWLGYIKFSIHYMSSHIRYICSNMDGSSLN